MSLIYAKDIHYTEFLVPKTETPTDPRASHYDSYDTWQSAEHTGADFIIESSELWNGGRHTIEWRKVDNAWRKTVERLL